MARNNKERDSYDQYNVGRKQREGERKAEKGRNSASDHVFFVDVLNVEK